MAYSIVVDVFVGIDAAGLNVEAAVAVALEELVKPIVLEEQKSLLVLE